MYTVYIYIMKSHGIPVFLKWFVDNRSASLSLEVHPAAPAPSKPTVIDKLPAEDKGHQATWLHQGCLVTLRIKHKMSRQVHVPLHLDEGLDDVRCLSQGYKYGSNGAHFGDEMKKILESPQIAVFAEQGEVVGKTKGRKKRDTATDGPEGSEKPLEKPPAKRQRGKTAAKTGEADTAKSAKPKAKQSDAADSADRVKKPKGGKKTEVEIPPLESIVDPIKPPEHVNSGTVYSNAYRKYQALHGKEDLTSAQRFAQLASAMFQAYGVVPKEYVGNFLSRPRRKTVTPQLDGKAPQQETADGGMDSVEEDGDADES